MPIADCAADFTDWLLVMRPASSRGEITRIIAPLPPPSGPI